MGSIGGSAHGGGEIKTQLTGLSALPRRKLSSIIPSSPLGVRRIKHALTAECADQRDQTD